MQVQQSQLTVRGQDTVAILMNDHQVIKSLLNDLLDAKTAAQHREIFESLKAALVVHNATEENVVYPALSQLADKKSESQKLYHETAEADLLVFDMDALMQAGDEKTFLRKAEKLRSAVFEHIDDEEKSAFPHLQKNMQKQQEQQLTKSVREFRQAFHWEPAGV